MYLDLDLRLVTHGLKINENTYGLKTNIWEEYMHVLPRRRCRFLVHIHLLLSLIKFPERSKSFRFFLIIFVSVVSFFKQETLHLESQNPPNDVLARPILVTNPGPAWQRLYGRWFSLLRTPSINSSH